MIKIPIADDSPTKPAGLKETWVPAAAALRRWLSHATELHILFPAIAVIAPGAILGTTLNLIRVERRQLRQPRPYNLFGNVFIVPRYPYGGNSTNLK